MGGEGILGLLSLGGFVRALQELCRGEGGEDAVGLFHNARQPLVCFGGRQVELGDEAVDLVDDEGRRHALCPCLPQHCMRLHAHALHRVHDQQCAVTESDRRPHLYGGCALVPHAVTVM